jgi:hypothetical protein
MSKLARALVATAIGLAAMTAVAPAQATSHDARHRPTDRQVTSPQQAAADTAHQRLLAQERSYSAQGDQVPTIQRARAQERYYSTWRYGDTGAPSPAAPSRQAASGWRIPALWVLVALAALIGGVAGLAARRATRLQRAGQTT